MTLGWKSNISGCVTLYLNVRSEKKNTKRSRNTSLHFVFFFSEQTLRLLENGNFTVMWIWREISNGARGVWCASFTLWASIAHVTSLFVRTTQRISLGILLIVGNSSFLLYHYLLLNQNPLKCNIHNTFLLSYMIETKPNMVLK